MSEELKTFLTVVVFAWMILLNITAAVFFIAWVIPDSNQTYGSEIDKAVYQEAFFKCLDKTAKARAGRDYTTHEDENYDSVIRECRATAKDIANTKVKKEAEND